MWRSLGASNLSANGQQQSVTQLAWCGGPCATPAWCWDIPHAAAVYSPREAVDSSITRWGCVTWVRSLRAHLCMVKLNVNALSITDISRDSRCTRLHDGQSASSVIAVTLGAIRDPVTAAFGRSDGANESSSKESSCLLHPRDL